MSRLNMLALFLLCFNTEVQSQTAMNNARYQVTSKSYKTAGDALKGACSTRSILDCGRQCGREQRRSLYYDAAKKVCLCDDGAFSARYLKDGPGEGITVSYGQLISEIKEYQMTSFTESVTADESDRLSTTNSTEMTSAVATTKSTDTPPSPTRPLSTPTILSPACSVNLTGLNPRGCEDILDHGCNDSGVYRIKPSAFVPEYDVYCDMTEDDGAWTVIQRRQDGSVNFSRSWDEYEQGFGDVSGEHWLGLFPLYSLFTTFTLRIELEDWDGVKVSAEYDCIEIDDEEDHFRLHTYGGYSGNAGDALRSKWNVQFSTMDNRPSSLINSTLDGGWWYIEDDLSSPNGVYIDGGLSDQQNHGIIWSPWRGPYYSLKRTEIKIQRPECPGK